MVFFLISEVLTWFLKICKTSWLMVFIATPETASWIPSPKSRVFFKYPFCTAWFQNNLCIQNRVLFRYVHLEVNMVSSKTKLSEFKTKSFTFLQCFETSVDMGLFSKAHIPVMGDKHHRHPIISGVTRNLFRATASCPFQNMHVPVAPFKGTPLWCAACNGKKYLSVVKKWYGFPSAGL